MAQLTDAQSGILVWSDRYDREAGHFFRMQDEITEHVVARIEPGLYAYEQLRSARLPPGDLDSWGRIVRAIGLVHRLERAANAEAVSLLDAALDVEPRNAKAHAVKSWALFWAQHCSWSNDRKAAVEAAKSHADLALKYDDDEPWSHVTSGFILSHGRRHAEAISALRAGLAINPSFSLGRLLLGWALVRAGRFEEAVAETGHALRLKPADSISTVYLATHGLALLAASRFDEALPFLRSSVRVETEYWGHFNCLISCCGHLGLLDEVRAVVDLRRRKLGRQLTLWGARRELEGFAHSDIFIEGLRLAGIPEQLDQEPPPAPWIKT